MMELRKTELKDLPGVMAVVSDARQDLHARGIDQWQNGYPDEAAIRQDITDESSYVLCENGQIIGTCCIRFEADPYYAHIEDGHWLNQEPYGVIHRIAVLQKARDKGCGRRFLQQAQQLAAARGITNLRADTHSDNQTMQHLLEHSGFQPCGIVYVSGHARRIAYQKLL